MAVTLKDITKVTGVHPSTISKVINGDPSLSIRDNTRKKILDAVEQMNYVSNPFARGLRRKLASDSTFIRTKNIGVLVSHELHPSGFGPCYSRIYKAMQDQAIKKGFTLMLHTLNGFSDVIPDIVIKGEIDGLILLGFLEAGFCKELISYTKQKKALVAVDHQFKELQINSITSSNYHSMREAVEYLFQMGHRKIAYVDSWESRCSSLIERFRAYEDVLTERGCYDKSLVERGININDRGYTATEKLISRTDSPTAVIYNNDEAALDGMYAIKAKGLKIPDDISICGFDGIEQGKHAKPELATINVDFEGMGKAAIDLLIETIEQNSGNAPRRIKHFEIQTVFTSGGSIS